MDAHRVRVPLRWVDLDAQGHANNAAILDYLQEARVDFLLRGEAPHLLGGGVIVVGHQVEFVAPVLFAEDPLDVELVVTDVGAARFTVAYRVHQAGVLVARARTQLANYDIAAGRPRRLTPAERAWLAGHLASVEPLREVSAHALGASHHTHILPVRWSDLDAYGHVNNTRFFDYVAEARVALKAPLLTDAIRATPDGAVAHAWLVARQDMRYVAQMRHRLAPYEVHTAVGAVGRTSLTLAAEIVDPGGAGVCARSTTILVHADAAGRPTPLPEPIVEMARRWPAAPTGRTLL